MANFDSGMATCTSNAITTTGSDTQDVITLGPEYSGNADTAASTSNFLQITVLGAGDVVFRQGFEAQTLDCPIE